MGWNNVFGGSTLQPSDVAFRAVTLTGTLALSWPRSALTESEVLARLMDVTPNAAGRAVVLPPANEASPGQDVLFANLGADAFTVYANDGVTVVATVTPGQRLYLYLRTNATANGTWGTMLLGVGSGTLDAAGIAGAGLLAVGDQLAQSSTTSTTASTPLPITAGSRASTFVWTGGTGIVSLPLVGTVSNTFFFEVRNQGSGSLTLTPSGGELVDGSASVVLAPSESCFVHAGSAAWYTVGRGRNTQFNFSLLTKAVTGGTVTLNNTEAANTVQRYTGTLVSNCTVVFPAVVQVYYVQNQTSGLFTLTFQSPTPGSTVAVPTGQNAVLFCDGVNVVNSSTTVSGISSLTLSQGSVSAPAINFSGNTNTGIYQPLTNTVAIACAGAEALRVTNTGVIVQTPSAGEALTIVAPGSHLGANALTASVYRNTAGSGIATFTNAAPGGSSFFIGVGATGTTRAAGTVGLGNLAYGDTILIGAAGNVTINAPSSGIALSVTSVNLGSAQQWSDGTRTTMLNFNAAGTQFGSTSNHSLDLYTNNTVRMAIAATGGVTINAPSGGVHLDLSGSSATIRLAGTAALASNGTITYLRGTGISFENAAGSTTWASISSAGNFIIAAPSGGNALTVNGLVRVNSTSVTIGTNSVGAGGNIQYVNDAGTTYWLTGLLGSAGATSWSLYDLVRGATPIAVSSTGNVAISAPSSGTALTVGAVPSGTAITVTDGTRQGALLFDSSNLYLGTNSNHALSFFTNNSGARMTISGTGNVTINAPTSGSHTITGSLSFSDNGSVTAALSYGSQVSFGSSSSHPFLLTSANGTRMQFSTAGRIQFGTSGTQWEIDTSNRLLNPGRNQPAFIARRTSTSQTTGTTVLFNTEDRDQVGEYDPSTGVYTAAVAGWRVASFMVYLNNVSGSAQNPTVQFAGTGAVYRGRDDFRGAGMHPNGDNLPYGASMVLWMNAGETLSVTSNVAFSALNVSATSGNHFSVVQLS